MVRRMLKKQRHQIILDYLDKNQFAKVETLNELTASSAITTRRDINELHDLGLIEKVYGGAQRLEKEKTDLSVEKRMESYMVEKDLIAQKAVSFVRPGSTIFLDAGSAVHSMIPYLVDLDVVVMTHGIHHVERLAQLGIDTHLIGGHVKQATLANVGSMTLEVIAHLNFDMAFMGTNAIDFDWGYSTPDLEEAHIKTKIIEQSTQVYVLADASKFHKKSHVKFADIEIPVITNYEEEVDIDNVNIIRI